MDQRVESLLSQMTLEEKIDYVSGVDGFYVRAVERLGLPAIKMSDGPMGVRNYGRTTAYPGGIALAATWNPDLAAAFGSAIGRDSRARGVHIWLAPGVNIYRSPLCGRNFEYAGEDPCLAGVLAAQVVRHVQKEGVMATVKHYACNNQEYDRHYVSSDLDERTLREIYLPAFRAAVVDGDAACVMSAYNLVNGVWCTEHDFLNNKILKQEWNFNGILMSDWGAVHHSIPAVKGGLDLEMPSGEYMNRRTLLPALERGEVDVKTIDDKVRRILRMILKFEFDKRPQLIDSISADDPASGEVALRMARESVVLLKNDDGVLPLREGRIRTLAVIGPNAHPEIAAGGGSSYTEPVHWVSILDGICARAGESVEVLHDPGNTEPDVPTLARASRFQHCAADGQMQDGLAAEYFDNPKLAGSPVRRGADARIDFEWKRSAPEGLPADRFSARWTGVFVAEKTGRHVLSTRADDGVRVWLDKELIIEDWGDHVARLRHVERDLQAGKAYDIKIEYYENRGDAILQFGVGPAVSLDESPALQIAKKADAVIFCAGFNRHLEFEGADRSFDLPPGQADLIRSLADVNPNTVVILNSGGGVAWDGWLGRVPAVLQAWYPGQEGGTAIAEILFGDVNPSGKLPATFEKKLEDNPAHRYYHAADGKTMNYREGIFVGYRGYDHFGIVPQFCFGHGLSYTRFDYTGLSVEAAASPSGSAKVSFTVKNIGDRAGAESAQIYVRDVDCSVPRPVKELKGFSKVFLQPGESTRVEVDLKPEAFMFFEPARRRWGAEPGLFEVLVGASSRDIRLVAPFELR